MEKRLVEGVTPRMETGVVQFGDDWPGVFIRGDDAFGFFLALERLLEIVDDPDPIEDYLAVSTVRSLARLMDDCRVRRADGR